MNTVDITTDKRLFAAIWICLGLSLAFTIIGFFSNEWIGDLCCHFRVQYLVFQIACLVLFLAMKKKRSALAAVTGGMINLMLIVPLYLKGEMIPQARATSNDAARLKVLFMNVNARNSHYDEAIKEVHRLQPDVLAVAELSHPWQAALSQKLPEYKFQMCKARNDGFGIGLFSKAPFTKAEVAFPGKIQAPTVFATFDFAGKPVNFAVVHPMPPITPYSMFFRDDMLNDLAQRINDTEGSFILAGDLNTTSWSSCFGKFLKDTQLNDTRQGFGVQGSWPTMVWPMLIPIDHVLTTSDWITIDRRRCRKIGSDHYPIFVELEQRGERT